MTNTPELDSIIQDLSDGAYSMQSYFAVFKKAVEAFRADAKKAITAATEEPTQ